MPADQTDANRSARPEFATEMIGADQPHAEIIDPRTRGVWQSIEPSTREERGGTPREVPKGCALAEVALEKDWVVRLPTPTRIFFCWKSGDSYQGPIDALPLDWTEIR